VAKIKIKEWGQVGTDLLLNYTILHYIILCQLLYIQYNTIKNYILYLLDYML
jgi:hypothetical protein